MTSLMAFFATIFVSPCWPNDRVQFFLYSLVGLHPTLGVYTVGGKQTAVAQIASCTDA